MSERTAAQKLGDELAFPCTPPVSPNGGPAEGYPYPEMGLRKRELFAAIAAQGLTQIYPQGGDFMEVRIAEGAVRIADELLRELAK